MNTGWASPQAVLNTTTVPSGTPEAAEIIRAVRAALKVLAPAGVDEATMCAIAAEVGIDPAAFLPPAPVRLAVPAAAVAPVASAARSVKMQENCTFAANLSNLAVLAQVPTVRDASAGVPLSESFGSALRGLQANKQRSVLTMLGIIIGVSSVILILSVGSGLAGFTREGFEKGPASNVTITGAYQRLNGIETGKKTPSLTVEDALALAQPGVIPDALDVTTSVKGTGQATYETANAAVTVLGVWPNYTTMNDYKVTRGDFISAADLAGNAPIVALGPNVAKKLFGDNDPIGAQVFLNGKSLRVVGVMEAKGAGTLDDTAYVPLTTALNQVLGAGALTANGQKTVDAIDVKATSLETVPVVEEQVQQFLDSRHHTTGGGRDFATSTALAIAKMVLQIISVINTGLIAIAAISLIVGGVGITNIMLVSVTERTREIGIRKAIGAKQGDILAQFIVEAVLISLVGAAIGVAIGGALVVVVNVAWRPAPVSPFGVLGAVIAAVATGVIFGVSPARKAAKLKPIDALRAE